MEFGWKSFVDNLKFCWNNCDGNLKSWVDDWKHYWNVGSGLNGLTVSDHCYCGSMRNSGDFSSHDCMFVHQDHYSALKRPHSSVQDIVSELGTQDTPQTHDSWLDSKYNPELKISFPDLVD